VYAGLHLYIQAITSASVQGPTSVFAGLDMYIQAYTRVDWPTPVYTGLQQC